MEQEFFERGDPAGWGMDELRAVNLPNCRCAMTPIVGDSIDGEFVAVDDIKMIEEKK